MFCITCGNDLKPTSKFCAGCGTPVPQPISAEIPASISAAPAATLVAAPALAAPRPVASAPPEAVPINAAGHGAAQSIRASGRSVAIAGLFLVMLFFSPFVSCGPQTATGLDIAQSAAQAAQSNSMSSGADDPSASAGILWLIPVAGLIIALAGGRAIMATEQAGAAAAKSSIALGASILSLIVLLAFGYQVNHINQSTPFGALLKLEWGYFASLCASLGAIAGSIGLRRARSSP